MRKTLFEVSLVVEVEASADGDMSIITNVPDPDPTVRQLAGVPLPVVARAVAQVERHLMTLYAAAQMRAFEASLGGAGAAADLSGFDKRVRPSAN